MVLNAPNAPNLPVFNIPMEIDPFDKSVHFQVKEQPNAITEIAGNNMEKWKVSQFKHANVNPPVVLDQPRMDALRIKPGELKEFNGSKQDAIRFVQDFSRIMRTFYYQENDASALYFFLQQVGSEGKKWFYNAFPEGQFLDAAGTLREPSIEIVLNAFQDYFATYSHEDLLAIWSKLFFPDTIAHFVPFRKKFNLCVIGLTLSNGC